VHAAAHVASAQGSPLYCACRCLVVWNANVICSNAKRVIQRGQREDPLHVLLQEGLVGGRWPRSCFPRGCPTKSRAQRPRMSPRCPQWTLRSVVDVVRCVVPPNVCHLYLPMYATVSVLFDLTARGIFGCLFVHDTLVWC
jgi:hypothetical protein